MYDVAFSFAGEDRAIVEKIKNIVSEEYSVFYDYDNQPYLVGKDLFRFLRNIYTNKAKYVACFLSEHYSKKIWTNLEFTAVKERLMNSFFDSDFLIPIVLDNTPITNDIPSFIGFYQHTDILKTAELIKTKIHISYPDNSLIEHRQNLLEYILNQIYETLQAHGCKVEIFQNKLFIKGNIQNNIFIFSRDKFLNLPCILIYNGENDAFLCADIVITWERHQATNFSIYHTFDHTSIDNRSYSLSEVIKIIAKDILLLSEVN